MFKAQNLKTTDSVRALIAQALNEREAGVDRLSVQQLFTACTHVARTLKQDLDRDRLNFEKSSRSRKRSEKKAR